MAAAITPADLATRLVVEAALPMIQDKVRGKLPIEGQLLTVEDRVRRGMTDIMGVDREQSTTLAYPANGAEVLFDLDRSQASVFFKGGDCDKAIALLDAALKRDYPGVQQEQDIAHPDNNGMRVRLYKIQLDPALLASIEASYPAPGGPAKQFVARVRAQIRRDVHDQIISDALSKVKKH